MNNKHSYSRKKEAFQAQFNEDEPIVIIDPKWEIENYTAESRETTPEKTK